MNEWKEQNACQGCGDDMTETSLRAIKMQDGRRVLLCRPCFETAVQEGAVSSDDPYLTGEYGYGDNE